MRDEDVDTSLADAFGIPRTFKTVEAGPHAVVTRDHNPFPGLRYKVIRDGMNVGCLVKIDSRRRTVTVFGMPLGWISHMESLGYDFNLSDEEIERIDIETRCVGEKEKVTYIPFGDGEYAYKSYPLPKSRVLKLNGIEEEFAGLEFEIPYDTVIVKLEDENDPSPWFKNKGKLPRHWMMELSSV